VRAALVVIVLLAAGCDPTGKACEKDDECGPGFDCHQNSCFRVCTKDDECPQGNTCFRYHCVVPGQENASRARPQKPAPSAESGTRPAPLPPPVPDATAAELRAIRRELELIHQDVQRLLANQAGAAPQTPPKSPPPRQLELPPAAPKKP
jgi:hypothetical protein